MSTLRQLTGGSLAIPAATAWYLADLGEFLDRALHQPGTPGRAEAGCYETLEQSSQGWHESTNDPWPYVNFVLSILKSAYRDLVERVGGVSAPRGAKTELVLTAINQFSGEFTASQLERECPGVSRDMVRRVLRAQQAAGVIECQGRGPAARWLKKG